MLRATFARPWHAALALTLACALLIFTTAYRNGSGFQAATAARCHSLSTDHTHARTLFDGDFGPLAILTAARFVAAPSRILTPRIDEAPAPPPRLLALLATPFRRPPPSFV